MQTGEYLLSQEKIGTAVRKLAVPAILSTMVSTIYNFTDTFFIGLLRDTAQLSALSLAMPVMWLASAICGIFAAGAPQVISLLMGAGDAHGARKCRSFSVWATLALSLLLTPAMLAVLPVVLRVMGAQGEILQFSAQYLDVIIATTAISAVSGALQGILRADGRTAQASKGSAIGIIVNIVLDPLFIFALKQGVRGAAIATALGSLASLVYCAICTRRDISLKNALPGMKNMRKMLALAMTSTATSVLNALIVGFSFTMANSFGGEVVASVSVASKLYTVVVSIVSVLAFSLQPFVGYNFAAKNRKRLRDGILTVLGVGTAVSLAGAVVFLTCGEIYMRLFSNDEAVISIGARMIRLFSIGTPVLTVNMVLAMYLTATGKALRSLVVGLARQFLIFIPVMLLLSIRLGVTGQMIAYPVTDILAAILSVILCRKEIADLMKKEERP